MTTLPVGSADNDPPWSGEVENTCYDIDVWNMPPIAVYDCETGEPII